MYSAYHNKTFNLEVITVCCGLNDPASACHNMDLPWTYTQSPLMIGRFIK